jgi:hypothetical protein
VSVSGPASPLAVCCKVARGRTLEVRTTYGETKPSCYMSSLYDDWRRQASYTNNTGSILINVTLRRVCVTMFAVEKQ